MQYHHSAAASGRRFNVLRRTVCPAFAVTLALALLSMSVHAQTSLVDKPAPDFALRSLADDNQRLSEHLGEVVIINFWATWCGPCRQEMPQLEELYGKYRRAGLVMLGISIDEDVQRATEMAQTLKITYPVLFDERKQVSRAFAVEDLPVTLLIDRAGTVRYVSEGYKPGYERRYAQKLRELLNE